MAAETNKRTTQLADHEVAALVNELRDEVKRICPNAPQMLREVISKVVTKHVKKK
tara:strand:+ start:121668 stop:121832 length:165 start_codon:yes stop_codon:yes gene_type:complete